MFRTPLRQLSLVLSPATALLVLPMLCSPALAIDDNLTKGATNNHIFEAGLWGENIDILNGGLNLTIPIGPEYKVSPELSYQLRLTYSSKIWEMNRWNIINGYRSRLHGRGQAGLGFALHLGRKYTHANYSTCSTNEIMFEDSTGALHPSGSPSPDGSLLKFEVSAIRAASGVAYVLGPEVQDRIVEEGGAVSQCPGGGSPDVDLFTNDYRGRYVTRVAGKNSDPTTGAPLNWVDITYENGNGKKHLIDRIADSRGRAIEFFNGDPAPGTQLPDTGYIDRIELPAFGTNSKAVYQFLITMLCLRSTLSKPRRSSYHQHQTTRASSLEPRRLLDGTGTMAPPPAGRFFLSLRVGIGRLFGG